MKIPILMYHKVGETTDNFLNVEAATFEKQVRFLKQQGYQAVTFAQAVNMLAGTTPSVTKPIVFTFDDGYVSVGKYAVPILEKQGWVGTIFAVSDEVGKTNAWDEKVGYAVLPLMGWDELKALDAQGWEIAAHTRTHPHLHELSETEARENIGTGKSRIEAELGKVVTTFCYPYGHYTAQTPSILKELGIKGACTTQSGTATTEHDLLELPRINVSSGGGLMSFWYRMNLRNLLPAKNKGKFDPATGTLAQGTD